MNLHVQSYDNTDDRGPQIFIRQLVPELIKLGWNIVPLKHADAVLRFTQNIGEAKWYDGVIITRCDGLYSPRESNPRQYDLIQHRYIHSDGIIFQSEYCKEIYANEYGPPNDKALSTIIHNGTSLLPIKSLSRGVVCSARWRDTKRPNLINNIAKLCPDITFHIAGEWNSTLETNMVAHGKQNWGGIQTILKKGNVFFHPAVNDPCPNALVEACASGLIPIVSNSGGCKELVSDASYVYKEPPDLEEIAGLIKKAINDNTKTKKEELSIAYAAKEYDAFIRKVIKKGKCRPVA